MADPLLSVNEYPADGTTTNFEVSFAGGYISKEHVTVRYFDSDGAIFEPTYTWVGNFTISIVPAPAAGGKVRIYRTTPADLPLVDFSDGSVVNEQTLDLNAKQAVFLAAEVRDIIGTAPDLDDLLAAGEVAADARDQAIAAQAASEAAAAAAEAEVDTAINALTASLISTAGPGLLGFSHAATYPNNTLGERLKKIVYVTDAPYDVKGDGIADDTAAIQAAIDSNANTLIFPPGVYRHGALNFNNAKQRIICWGATFLRINAATTITVSAREVTFLGAEFSGGGLSGNNLTVTAPRAVFFLCDSTGTSGRALLFDNDGGNAIVFGGVYNTTDHTGTGYEIELRSTVLGGSLYTKIIGISTESTFGGILIDGQGTLKVSDCQFGKLTVVRGGGSYVNNRIIGVAVITGDSNQFTNTFFANDITFGDGVSPNVGGYGFSSCNTQASGKTFTIHSNVVESSFHLGQLANITLVINGHNNMIWHGRRTFTPTLGASGGSPAAGSAVNTLGYSRNGRDIHIDGEFVGAGDTNYGTGEFWLTGPLTASQNAQGAVGVTEDGVRSYVGTVSCAAGSNQLKFMLADTGGDQNAGATYPFVWAADDRFRYSITIRV